MAYCHDDRDPKEIPKSQFGLGLLPCNSDCRKKVTPADSELKFRKSEVLEVSKVNTLGKLHPLLLWLRISYTLYFLSSVSEC